MRSVDTIARRGKSAIRERFASAGLGRLGNAIDGRGEPKVVRFGAEGFTVSAQFFIRSRSERTLGAIKSYTEGATITPRRGRWLWIPTDQVRRLAGSNVKGEGQRMTPALWRERGFDRRIGPLVLIQSVNGQPRKGQVEKDMVVAFIGIPHTAPAARVDVTAILETIRADLPNVFASNLAKEER